MLVVLFVGVSSIFAQDPTQPLPLDPAVRVGVLDNGMTYFIRHNDKPKGQASFYIYHDVGAIQEDDDQQGLAHFLEHMAFNGTKNLPGKAIIEKLETIGVQFGNNLNAFTSWDCTQYMVMDLPVTEENVDLALLILHDWSQFIALQPEEIDSERGVIMEELRTRDGAGLRAQNDMIKNLFKGSLYEHRNLIGYLDGLKSFDHTALENFYKKWYRPEYQAIVIVGDVDVDQVEAKIKTLMADIPASPADAAQKDVITVPATEEPIISVFTDPELTQSSVMMFARRDAMPKEFKNTLIGISYNYIYSFVMQMMSARFDEIAQAANAPFLGGGMSEGSIGICPTLESTMFSVTAHEGRTDEAFRAMYTEMERMRRHGFTVGEFERAKQEILRWAERQYTNRNDVKNAEYAQRCLDHYAEGTPMLDAETEWQLDQALINSLTVDQINQAYSQLVAPNENLVILVRSPKKDGVVVPTEEQIKAIIAEVSAAEVEPYKDDTVIEPLIDPATKFKGSVVKSTVENESLGYTEWTLKNGIKVVVRPSTLKADEVIVTATSKGGLSMLTDEEYYQGAFLGMVMGQSGIGKFSATELAKQLSGKSAYTSLGAGEYEHSVNAGGSPKDIETILQLVYLNFTAPRFDETDLQNMKNMYVPYFNNMESDPNYIVGREFQKTMYGNHARRQITSAAQIEALNIPTLQAIHSKLYGYADDFRFVIVGNVDLETLKPLVEKYIGSLPTSKKVEYAVVDDGVRFVDGNVVNDFRTTMQQPKVSVRLVYSGDMANNAKNRMIVELLSRALDSRYMISIREEKGGTYGVSVQGGIEKYPTEEYMMAIIFDTNEQLADELIEICDKEIKKIAEEGPLADDVAKSKEFLQKNYNNVLENNGGWMSAITRWYEEGYNYKEEYLGVLESVTLEDVKAFAQKMLNDGNRTLVVMRPEAADAE
ncbi:MAG: insulinase family protein [Rikenellaceae bacterium]|nr:insulinase family protein [Rikenellaceae bacterium]